MGCSHDDERNGDEIMRKIAIGAACSLFLLLEGVSLAATISVTSGCSVGNAIATLNAGAGAS